MGTRAGTNYADNYKGRTAAARAARGKPQIGLTIEANALEALDALVDKWSERDGSQWSRGRVIAELVWKATKRNSTG